METTSLHSIAIAGPSTEANTSSIYDEDSRHLATTASGVPVPAGTLMQPAALASQPLPEMSVRDVKNHGTRFHEECHETDSHSPRLRSSRMFKGKGKDAVCIEKEKKKPLNLLDLPLDILKDIVKEVTHTNDLTSLALCHSALHRLTTPHIYSRFDIVWPDTNTHAEPRSGVDALTYGLATLVMAEEIFGEAPGQREANGNRFNLGGQGHASDMTVRRRRGNHYAHFTRKFSLGNGPPDWVQEYLITKEGGKMLGTLVALAVARMRALETFIWDMPTGILRDVWLALSSLADRNDDRPCRLEKVWVRWHDNSSADATTHMPPPALPVSAGVAQLPSSHTTSHPLSSIASPLQVHPAALNHVERPSFSVLPPLKSLSVLDIDEIAYLDEMAVLIGKSLDKLRELRIGIARQVDRRDWTTVWEGSALRQIDAEYPTASSLTIGEKRLGGILGTLTGLVCDMRKPQVVLPDRTRRSLQRSANPMPKSPTRTPASSATVLNAGFQPPLDQSNDHVGITSLRDMLPDVPTGEPCSDIAMSPRSPRSARSLYSDGAFENDPLVAQSSQHTSPLPTPNCEPEEPVKVADLEPESQGIEQISDDVEQHYLDNKLQIESLELERVPLSIPVLQKAIDWTRLTSLTLLHCHNHEQLWKTLRRTFAPVPKSPTYPHPRRTPTTSPRKSGRSSYAGSDIELEYGLKLKKIHTNAVSPALISFLKDTLASNSLEVLFLQEARSYVSSVTVDQIFKGPLRRHRNSLKKILIDSSEKGSDGLPTNSSRWRRWMLSREILTFICSGKMPALRELGMAIDYRDWHFFLQHLPSIPHLRSLSVPFLADHVHGSTLDPRELALQIVDIVALRPEVELCYMGIANKCFEIIENRRSSDAWDARPESHLGLNGNSLDEDDGHTASDPEDDDDDDDEPEGTPDDDVDGVPANVEADTESDEDDEDDDGTDSEAGSSAGGRGSARLRLREILFYDDKVAIFKARHGRL